MAQDPKSEDAGDVEQAPTGQPASGFPEPPGEDPGDRSGERDPHHALNVPVGEPDPTEWPDPYDRREDPLAPYDPWKEEGGAPRLGAESTSQPHPDQDPHADENNPPARDNLDQ